ncbi:ABC transporter ATP-binding protein [Haloplanus rallus]|jgi:branched-chain amino acid transport system ATP-binding protein|uniref:ABC transporter ATP-binding protein n=1 Tax=Haloplanus rallus TaxID=1816183 RepID=A0A6B9FDQ7_9EURY|nr:MULTISPECIES: ABC transporter ATP-binding protein [Haloplanus]QGX94239.1 ABC transporter ATP-binding protein [Haloplanus rallus]
MSGDSILEIESIRKEYGSLVAVDDVSFDVERGQILGLIGPNGAGKSTLFDLITGVQTPDGGTVNYDGQDITGNSLERNVELGLVRTFQQTRVLGQMTVRENLLVASQLSDQPRERADELLDVIELTEKSDILAEGLSFGQQKLISISQALMLDPEIILLDEPLAGVNPTMENKILDLIHEMHDEGTTFVFVEHDMDVIMSECEDIVVMNSGRLLTRGPPKQIQNDDRVIEAYFGGEGA